MRRATLGLALLLAVTACGIDMGEARVGPAPMCDTTSRGTLILMAQAIPDADYVPCFLTLPDRWVLERADVETGDVELSVDRDGVGDVEIQLSPTCVPGGEEVMSTLPDDVDVFEVGEPDLARWYVFAGGCVSIESDGEGVVDMSAMVDQIWLLSRDELRQLSGLGL